MNVETFGGTGKHQGGGPLLRPHPDAREYAARIMLPGKFTEPSAVALLVDRTMENFHPGDPDVLELSPRLRAGQFSGLGAGRGEALG